MGDLKLLSLAHFYSVIHIIFVKIYKKKERKSPLLILRIFEFHLRVLRGINIMMVVSVAAGARIYNIYDGRRKRKRGCRSLGHFSLCARPSTTELSEQKTVILH